MSALVFAMVLAFAPADPAPAAPAGHVTGIGGVFVKSPDPKALRAWYKDVLGIDLQAWGGATTASDAPGHPPVVVWQAFSQTSTYMAPSTRDFMLDFTVDDMDAMLARLTAKNVQILKRDDSDPSGRFAWIIDPDGTKIELWQPK